MADDPFVQPIFLPIFLVFFKKNTNFAPETLNT